MVEELKNFFKEAVLTELFEGLKVGSNGLKVNNYQYVDDDVLVGATLVENCLTIIEVIRSYKLVSDLKVNFTRVVYLGLM